MLMKFSTDQQVTGEDRIVNFPPYHAAGLRHVRLMAMAAACRMKTPNVVGSRLINWSARGRELRPWPDRCWRIFDTVLLATFRVQLFPPTNRGQVHFIEMATLKETAHLWNPMRFMMNTSPFRKWGIRWPGLCPKTCSLMRVLMSTQPCELAGVLLKRQI